MLADARPSFGGGTLLFATRALPWTFQLVLIVAGVGGVRTRDARDVKKEKSVVCEFDIMHHPCCFHSYEASNSITLVLNLRYGTRHI